MRDSGPGHEGGSGCGSDGSGRGIWACSARSVVTLLVAAGCTTQMIDETVIASDAMQGRNNLTQGSVNAQSYLIYRLKSMAVGLDTTKTGDDAFKQSWAGGTNILAKIPGTDLAERVRDRRRALRPPRQRRVAPRSPPTRSATARPTTAPASPRCSARGDDQGARRAAAHGDPRGVGPRGGRPRRIEVVRRPPARAARPDRRLRQLRHPGREPAAEPAEQQLRGRRGDGRLDAHLTGEELDRDHVRCRRSWSARSSGRAAATT